MVSVMYPCIASQQQIPHSLQAMLVYVSLANWYHGNLYHRDWHWGNTGGKGGLFFLALMCPLLIAPEGAKASTAP